MSTDDTPTVPVPEGVGEDDLPQPEEFPTTRMQQGYKAEQVDALIEDVFEAVRTGEPAPSIADAKFDATAGLRKGYEEEAVDNYLDELSEAVGQEPTPDPAERATVEAGGDGAAGTDDAARGDGAGESGAGESEAADGRHEAG